MLGFFAEIVCCHHNPRTLESTEPATYFAVRCLSNKSSCWQTPHYARRRSRERSPGFLVRTSLTLRTGRYEIGGAQMGRGPRRSLRGALPFSASGPAAVSADGAGFCLIGTDRADFHRQAGSLLFKLRATASTFRLEVPFGRSISR